MNAHRFAAIIILTAFLMAVSVACKKKPQGPQDPAMLYNEGLAFMSRGKSHGFFNPPDYEKAREKFQEIMYDHPTSRYAPLAELKIADTYYEQGDYELSASSYDSWRKNHVGRPELPYATYRVAMSYYHQVYEIDRDQTNTRMALYEFQHLVGVYPNSEYAAAVGDKMEILKTKLAKHEFYVGKFYYRHRDYWAAADRFQSILDNFPHRGMDEAALFWSWRSYVRLGRSKEAYEAFNTLNERFPEGSLTRRAKLFKGKTSEEGARGRLKPH